MKIKYTTLPLLILFLFIYLSLFANALTDDAFITLQYVKTILHSGTWGFLPGYVTNAVTSPLNIFLLSVVGFFLGPTIDSILWLTACILAVTVLVLVQLSNHLFQTKIFGYIASAALVFNPLLNSTLGLESYLFVALYIVATYLYVIERWSLLAITLGLLTLTRFDGVLFFVASLLLVPGVKPRLHLSGTYLVTIAPWYLFSWIYFGSIFPDTLFIKVVQRAWGTWDFFNGLRLYYGAYRWETIFSLLLLPLLLLLFNRQVRHLAPIRFLLLTSVAHFTGYTLLRVPPYYWYYAPEITSIILVATISLGQFLQTDHFSKWNRTGRLSMAAGLILLQAFGILYLLGRDAFRVKEMPIHTNWATHEQYKMIGTWLKEHSDGRTIIVDGEIGTLGYYCDCRLSSFFSDRRWLKKYVEAQTSGSGLRTLLYKINFLFFDRDAIYSEPDFLLAEIPSPKNINAENIMQWKTSTRWVTESLVRLSDYSP
jgi:hypothetical protein